MRIFIKKSEPQELPEKWNQLIRDIHNNHPDRGGKNRAAVAEIQARAAWELNRATKGLKTATWILAFSTVMLCAITIYKS
jgi:hypothetical protein